MIIRNPNLCSNDRNCKLLFNGPFRFFIIVNSMSEFGLDCVENIIVRYMPAPGAYDSYISKFV